MTHKDPYDAAGSSGDVDEELGSAAEDDAERVRKALAELASLPPEKGEALVLQLLRSVESGSLPLSSVLGYTDDDLYNLYEKAYALYQGGRPKNALAVCDALLALNPGLPAAMLLMAGSLMDLRQYERALEVIEEVLSIDEEDLEAHLKHAHVLFRLGRIEEAAAALAGLLELDPDLESDEAKEAGRILEHVRSLLES